VAPISQFHIATTGAGLRSRFRDNRPSTRQRYLGSVAGMYRGPRQYALQTEPAEITYLAGFLPYSTHYRRGDSDLALGTVKWFNATKGYGFIQPDGGGPDVFVHISAVEKAGYTGLADGAKVSYELVTTRNGKTAAENLRIG
jgi:CspA family cold shock protein